MQLHGVADESIRCAAGGGTGFHHVTAPAGCAWTGVSNNTGWLTVTSGASGSGNGTVAFSASANPNTHARAPARLLSGARRSRVTQAAASCTYALAPTSHSVAAGWRHGFNNGDGAGRVCMDGRQQQHRLADGDERGERQRDWYRGVQRVGQSEYELARTGTIDDRGPDVQRDAERHVVRVLAFRPTSMQPVPFAGGQRIIDRNDHRSGCAWTAAQRHVVDHRDLWSAAARPRSGALSAVAAEHGDDAAPRHVSRSQAGRSR